MKQNIFALPTNGESRVVKFKDESKLLIGCVPSIKGQRFHIYITNDEISGFENNIWVIRGKRVWLWQNTMALDFNNKPKKIILTTDPKLIADGVQSIDDNFLNWFVKNPSCESVEVYEVGGKLFAEPIIPQEEPEQEPCGTCGKTLREQMKGCNEITCYRQFLPKQESIEEAAEKYENSFTQPNGTESTDFIAGAKSMIPIIKELGEALQKAQNKYVNPKRTLMGGDIENSDYLEIEKTLHKYKQYIQ